MLAVLLVVAPSQVVVPLLPQRHGPVEPEPSTSSPPVKLQLGKVYDGCVDLSLVA